MYKRNPNDVVELVKKHEKNNADIPLGTEGVAIQFIADWLLHPSLHSEQPNIACNIGTFCEALESLIQCAEDRGMEKNPTLS